MAFCGQCGSALAGAAVQTRTPIDHSAERRHLTVLFCDVVNSTGLAGALDEEDLRTVILDYQAAAGAIVRKYEGYIAQYLGDGILIYFGYPTAQENAAERAIYAGLEIVEAITALAPPQVSELGIDFAVRLGIHSGSVVTGDLGEAQNRQRLAVGQTPNIAARLQDIAEPNGIVISGVTADLVAGTFEMADMGQRRLKGIEEPLRVFQVERPTQRDQKFLKAKDRPLSPFVGRDEEVHVLRREISASSGGIGRTVLICGDAGIGKSRLLAETRSLEGSRSRWIVLRCSAFLEDVSLHPLVEFIGSQAGWRVEDTADARLEKLERYLDDFALDKRKAVALLAPLLTIDPGPDYPAMALSPKQLTDQLFKLLEQLLLAPTEEPLVLVVEDLHWIDLTTLEFVDLLILRIAAYNATMVLTYRPDFKPSWYGADNIIELQLEPLADTVVRTMIGSLFGEAQRPDWVSDEILNRTDGVPIFVEELTRMMRDHLATADNRADDEIRLAIPETLQDSLFARLDRLGPAREVIQIAAFLGRAFSYELLRAIWPYDEVSLTRHLHLLLREALLVHASESDRAQFRFHHALIQDAAYASLLRAQRNTMHVQIADVLIDEFPELTRQNPVTVADHLTRGGEETRAIPYWYKAGQTAVRQNARPEAINLFRRGIKLIEMARAPDDVELAKLELKFQIELGKAIATAYHWGHVDAQAAFERADQLCRQLDDVDRHFGAILHLRMSYTSAGRHDDAMRQARTAVETAEHFGGRHEVLARVANVHPNWHLAHFTEALKQVQLGFAAIRRLPDPPDRFAREQSLYLLANVGQPSWALGMIDDCYLYLEQAQGLFETDIDPFARCFFQVWGASTVANLRDFDLLRPLLTDGVAETEKMGYTSLGLWGQVITGWLMAQTGDARAGLALLETALDAYLIGGSQADLPQCYLYLADTQLQAGLIEDALVSIDQALEATGQSGEVCHLAELFRLKGEITLRTNDAPGALRLFDQASEVARNQGALGWRLRAETSRVRLRADLGQADVDGLRDVCAAYDDCRITLDLADARALLEAFG